MTWTNDAKKVLPCPLGPLKRIKLCGWVSDMESPFMSLDPLAWIRRKAERGYVSIREMPGLFSCPPEYAEYGTRGPVPLQMPNRRHYC